MESMLKILYTTKHETFWKPEATGEAAPAGHPVTEEKEKSAGSVTEIRMLGEFSFSLVERISEERLQCLETETGVREAAQIEPAAKTGIDPNIAERCDELRIYDRSLDSTQGNGSNRRSLWHFLSSKPPMAISRGTGLELPETGKKNSGKRRAGDCVLEKNHMAEYKKKPKRSEPTWCSSTRVGSCSFLTLSEHGRPGERLLSSAVQEDGKRSPLSLLSASLRNEKESQFMPVFTRTETSNLLKLPDFSIICSNICAAQWYCSGTAERRTKDPLSMRLSANIPVCIVTDSPDIPQNSTLMNLSGVRSNVPCPTVSPETCVILNNSCILRYRECGNPRKCSGLVSMLLICHGVNNVSFTYA